MADASKLKHLRRSGLGTPPSIEEARSDLAPSPEQADRLASHRMLTGRGNDNTRADQPDLQLAASAESRVDGRTLRRSGRTVQFATRVSPEFDQRIRRIARRDGMLLVEVLEQALDALEANRQKEAR